MVGTVIIIISMLNIWEPRSSVTLKAAVSKRESQEFNLGLLALNYSLLNHLSWNCTSLQVGMFYLYVKALSTTVSRGALEMPFCCHDTFFLKTH